MTRKLLTAATAALAISLATTGCATAKPPIVSRSMGDLVFGAAQSMASGIDQKHEVRPNSPVIITTIVSVDDLNRSSTFGRLTSQLILSKLSAMRFMVKDVTYMQGVLDINRETGELVLSRDAERLSREAGATAVVVGTYAVGGEMIYVNIRMLSTADGRVMGSSAAAIPLNNDTAPLVWSNGTPQADLQRPPPPSIPVREPRG